MNRRNFLASVLVTGGAMLTPEISSGEESQQTTPTISNETAAVDTMTIDLTINGAEHHLPHLEVNTTLLDCLRDSLHLTGTKKGCGLGQCGACTVLVDDRRVKSCLCLAVMQQGKQITTIEGMGTPEELHSLQEAFIEHDAFQCGYCTSGQIMSGVACIREGHAGSDDEVREWMSGNLCRCGAYTNIVAAVREVARRSASA